MMLCLANIGDGMAHSFRFLYWKVCCYACTKRPKKKHRKSTSRSRYPSSHRSRTSSYNKRPGRASQRSADSQFDSEFYDPYTDYKMYDDMEEEDRTPGYQRQDRSRTDDRKGKHSDNPSPSRRTPVRDQDHLELPPDNPHGEGRILYNKYAIDKEEMNSDEPMSYRSGRSPKGSPKREGKMSKDSKYSDATRDSARDDDPERGYSQDLSRERDRRDHPRDEAYLDRSRSRDGDKSREMGRHHRSDHRDYGRMHELPVIKSPKHPGGSFRGPRPPYNEPPSIRLSQRDSGYYSRYSHSNDPRGRYGRYDYEYNYDDKYIDEDDYEEEMESEEDIDESRTRPVPIWLGVMLVVAYIFGGAFLFKFWEEKWTFLESVYFCFITLTTIGFGDFVPGQNQGGNDEYKIAACSVYLLFGIALLAMSFNLIQEEVITNVKRVAKRLGIIKEKEEHTEIHY